MVTASTIPQVKETLRSILYVMIPAYTADLAIGFRHCVLFVAVPLRYGSRLSVLRSAALGNIGAARLCGG